VLDDSVCWEGRPSQWSTLLHYAIAAVVIAAGVVLNPLLIQGAHKIGLANVQPGLWLCSLGAIYAFWQFLAVRCIRYTITKERLLDESGVLNRITDTLELYRVKDTQGLKPVWIRPFGLGHVRIESSDRTTPVTLLYAIAKPKEAAMIIRNRVEEMRVRKGVRELD